MWSRILIGTGPPAPEGGVSTNVDASILPSPSRQAPKPGWGSVAIPLANWSDSTDSRRGACPIPAGASARATTSAMLAVTSSSLARLGTCTVGDLHRTAAGNLRTTTVWTPMSSSSDERGKPVGPERNGHVGRPGAEGAHVVAADGDYVDRCGIAVELEERGADGEEVGALVRLPREAVFGRPANP